MAMSHTDGPITAGTQKPGSAKRANIGNVVLSQTVILDQNSTSVVDGILGLPSGSQIVDFYINVLTAFNSGTSATLSIGQSSGGTEYVGSVNAKTAGRAAPTLSAAKLAAMDDIGTNTDVYVSITPSGATSAGQVRVTVFYVQM